MYSILSVDETNGILKFLRNDSVHQYQFYSFDFVSTLRYMIKNKYKEVIINSYIKRNCKKMSIVPKQLDLVPYSEEKDIDNLLKEFYRAHPSTGSSVV